MSDVYASDRLINQT